MADEPQQAQQPVQLTPYQRQILTWQQSYIKRPDLWTQEEADELNQMVRNTFGEQAVQEPNWQADFGRLIGNLGAGFVDGATLGGASMLAKNGMGWDIPTRTTGDEIMRGIGNVASFLIPGLGAARALQLGNKAVKGLGLLERFTAKAGERAIAAAIKGGKAEDTLIKSGVLTKAGKKIADEAKLNFWQRAGLNTVEGAPLGAIYSATEMLEEPPETATDVLMSLGPGIGLGFIGGSYGKKRFAQEGGELAEGVMAKIRNAVRKGDDVAGRTQGTADEVVSSTPLIDDAIPTPPPVPENAGVATPPPVPSYASAPYLDDNIVRGQEYRLNLRDRKGPVPVAAQRPEHALTEPNRAYGDGGRFIARGEGSGEKPINVRSLVPELRGSSDPDIYLTKTEMERIGLDELVAELRGARDLNQANQVKRKIFARAKYITGQRPGQAAEFGTQQQSSAVQDAIDAEFTGLNPTLTLRDTRLTNAEFQEAQRRGLSVKEIDSRAAQAPTPPQVPTAQTASAVNQGQPGSYTIPQVMETVEELKQVGMDVLGDFASAGLPQQQALIFAMEAREAIMRARASGNRQELSVLLRKLKADLDGIKSAGRQGGASEFGSSAPLPSEQYAPQDVYGDIVYGPAPSDMGFGVKK